MVLFLAAAFWLSLHKKTTLVRVIFLSFLMVFLRVPAKEKETPVWNRNMEVKGRFLPAGDSSEGTDTTPFIIHYAQDG